MSRMPQCSNARRGWGQPPQFPPQRAGTGACPYVLTLSTSTPSVDHVRRPRWCDRRGRGSLVWSDEVRRWSLKKKQNLQSVRLNCVPPSTTARLFGSKLSRAGWTINRATPTSPKPQTCCSWLLYLQPSAALRHRFELAPEVLACVSPFEIAQARDIDDTEYELSRTHRLDRGVALFLTMGSAARELEAAVPPTSLPLRRPSTASSTPPIPRSGPSISWSTDSERCAPSRLGLPFRGCTVLAASPTSAPGV